MRPRGRTTHLSAVLGGTRTGSCGFVCRVLLVTWGWHSLASGGCPSRLSSALARPSLLLGAWDATVEECQCVTRTSTVSSFYFKKALCHSSSGQGDEQIPPCEWVCKYVYITDSWVRHYQEIIEYKYWRRILFRQVSLCFA